MIVDYDGKNPLLEEVSKPKHPTVERKGKYALAAPEGGFQWWQINDMKEMYAVVTVQASVPDAEAIVRFAWSKIGSESAPTEVELPKDPESWYVLTISGVVQKMPATYDREWWYWADAEADPCPKEAVEHWVEVRAALQQIAKLKEQIDQFHDAIATCKALQEWGRCDLQFVGSQARGLCNLYADCVKTLGLVADQRDAMNAREQKAVEKLNEAQTTRNLMAKNNLEREAISLLTSQEGK